MSVELFLAASEADAGALTADRSVATVAAFVALAGLVVGGLAVAGRLRRHRGAAPVVALVAGAVGLVVGGLVVVTADGGPGTGNGIVGGFAAVGFGAAAVLLGGVARARRRHGSGRAHRGLRG